MLVVSSARKLILRPEADAPVVSFPEGVVISDYGVNNATPSIVVCNRKENPPSWQGVGHETGVVIVNEVPEDKAEAALNIFEQGGQTNTALNEVLQFLVESGCGDQYTTSISFATDNLSPAGRMLDRYSGIVKRDERDQFPLWKEGDNIYVRHAGGPKLIAPDILLRTYRNPDGSSIDLSKIPEGKPEE